MQATKTIKTVVPPLSWQDELNRIKEAHQGLLIPEEVVKAAEDSASPLHHFFQWDNTIAAHGFRLWQARNLIVRVTVIEPNSKESIQVYVSLKQDRIAGNGYRTMVDVMNDVDLRAQLLRDALEDLKIFERKYQRLKELAPIFKTLAKMIKKQGESRRDPIIVTGG